MPTRLAWKRSVTRDELARLIRAARRDGEANDQARSVARTAAAAVNANRRIRVYGRVWKELSMMNQEHLLC